MCSSDLLNESAQKPRFIRTIPTRGYRFIAEVTVSDDEKKTEEPGLEEGDRSPTQTRPRRIARAILIGTVVFLALAMFALLTERALRSGPLRRSDDVTYRQLTFERGTVWTARFLPGSPTVVYNANFNYRGLDLYTFHLVALDSHPLGQTRAQLLSISSQGDMALLRDPTYIYQFVQREIGRAHV